MSEGCRHCYVYRMDSRHEKDASEVKNYQNILFMKSKWYLRVVNRARRQE